MKVLVHLIKSFTRDRGAGKAAGVVADADVLTTQQMLKITKDVGFSESAFLQESDKGDITLRLFSAVDEVAAAVTPTIASAYLISKDKICFETRLEVREYAGN
jgi:PhzF family phenazine biosynthesis protein